MKRGMQVTLRTESMRAGVRKAPPSISGVRNAQERAERETDIRRPLPGRDAVRPSDSGRAFDERGMLELARTVPANRTPLRRNIRRAELRQIVPLADTTIYELERRGEFPQRFYITSRCVAWDLEEVEAWIDARRKASNAALLKRAPVPDVRQRKRRPVRGESAS